MATMRPLHTEHHGELTLEQLEVTENNGETRTGWDLSCNMCGEAVVTAVTETEARAALTEPHVCGEDTEDEDSLE